MKLTEQYEALPQVGKILLQLFFGGIIGGVYRVIRYTETRNIVTLIAGIVLLATGLGNFIAWIVDLVTEILYNRITIFAD